MAELLKTDEKEALAYQPTPKEQKMLDMVSRDWEAAYEQRNRVYRHLNRQSLELFWQRSRDHYNGYVPELDSVEDEWKSRAFKKKTRHKVIATVANFLSSGIGLDFFALNKDDALDQEMSKVIEDVYDWSIEREDFDTTLLKAYMEMVITGTVHLYEEIAWDSREIREIMDIDFETGKITWDKKDRTDFKGARSELVPNDEMFPGDSWEPDIQEQPYIIRRKITTFESASNKFGKWDNWKFVEPGGNFFLPGARQFETEEEDSDLDDNNVEIVYYWNKMDDKMCIVINSVLMTQPDYPFPYPHKNYPFAKSVYETFADQRFYWGDSFPNKNWDDQEITNQLWRMFIDSTKLKNKPPLFTNNAELASTDLIVPGTIVPHNLGDTFETIPQISQGVSQSEFNVLTLAERQIDENSIDPLLAGQTPAGDPTATEVRAIVGSAERLAGFNQQFVASLLLQHAHLRIPNLLWFMTHDDQYKEIVKDRVKTSGGKVGKRRIKFLNVTEIPSEEDLFLASVTAEKQGEATDFVYVDKDAVNDYRFHTIVASVPKPRRSKSARIMAAIQKYNLYVPNPLIDQTANTEKLIEALGDDPDALLQKAPPGTPAGAKPTDVKLPPQNQALTAAMAQAEEQSPMKPVL